MKTACLAQFIAEKYGIKITQELIGDDEDVLDLLMNLYISPTNEPSLGVNNKGVHLPLDELLSLCKQTLLLNQRSENVLVEGYKTAGEGSIDSNLYSKNTDLYAKYLNNPAWRKIMSIIGTDEMCDILLNHSGFLKMGKSFVHLFGPSIGKKFEYEKDQSISFSLDRALYRGASHAQCLNPIPSRKILFVKEIFKNDYQNREDGSIVLKRHKPFLTLADNIVSNHLKLRYFPILFNICHERKNVTDNLELALNKKEIMRFCTVVFDSIFPKDVYGSSHNKSHIFQCLSNMVFGSKNFRIPLQTCITSIKIKCIPWLGKNLSGNMNKQDFIKRESLLKCFIVWLFDSFFPKLLASFFHITHISSSQELLFFYHKTWIRISRPFMKKYVDHYLTESDEFEMALKSGPIKTIDSKLRIMPKKANDFRIINTPMRGTLKTESFEYINRVNAEIRPAKRIINQLRLSQSSKFPKITSIGNVPRYLGDFKNLLIKRYGKIPKLYFVKFDVKSCYDNIPRDKVSSILSELLKKEEVYYYCSRSEIDLSSLSSKQFKFLRTSENLNDILHFKKDKQHLLQKTNVSSMCGTDILNTAKSQLNYSLTKIGNCSYARKIGVFQGLHHSSLFCDIVYDKMIDERFYFLAETESIVLRIADDFLVISSDPTLSSKAKHLLEDGIPEYGVTINALKTVVNFSSMGDCDNDVGSIKFCGFQIDTYNLDILKEFDTVPKSSVFFKSHTKVINKLIGIYKYKISYNTLDLKVNSFETVLRQLKMVVQTVADSYCVYSKGTTLSLKGFQKFMNQMLVEAMSAIKLKKGDLRTFEIERTVIGCFLKTLVKKNTKFGIFIDYLESEMSIRAH